MATPRSELVDADQPMHCHLISRCVRRSWICGFDRPTKRNYEHRKQWLEERIFFLVKHFAVSIDAYAIMSNHFHLVVYFDPREAQRWSDLEVSERWLAVCPPDGEQDSQEERQSLVELHKQILLERPEKLLHARKTLGSLSMFMRHLKQPIAFRANKEDRCSGHFFEGRFYSGALLDENAVIAAMAYVDLNPVRAKIVQRCADYQAASAKQRVKFASNTHKRLKEALGPLVSSRHNTASCPIGSCEPSAANEVRLYSADNDSWHRLSVSDCRAKSKRNGQGKLRTHCLTGTVGIT